MSAALIACAAVALDWLLGEPRRLHPLAGFGRLAAWLERHCYGAPQLSAGARRRRGLLAWMLATLPLPALLCAARGTGWAAPLQLAVLYFALGHRSLHQHALPVAEALDAGRGEEARRLAARIVSRDAETLEPAAATVESVLENGNDAVFGALFWFALAGAPGALLYRLANTLDAMWGYRSPRYLDFGRAAARLDDVLNWAPARLTALSYALLGRTAVALRCWRSQAARWDSPNAGPVMAAGAGALAVRLGGPARYRGQWHERAELGAGRPAAADSIRQALALVRRGVLLWLAAGLLLGALVDA